MGRLMARNDETDGGRDKRDTHVRGHYSSAAHTHAHNTANATQGCRRNCLPPASLYFCHRLSFFPSAAPFIPPLSSVWAPIVCFPPRTLQCLSPETRIIPIESYSSRNCETCLYHLHFKWSSNGRDITG